MDLGDIAPDFSLPDQNGQMIRLNNMLKEQWVVLFFYPKDETPGCIAEVCAFRDAYEKFTEAGAEVIGISSGSGESHRKFHKKYNLPFKLLNDIDGKIRKLYKVANTLGFIPGRTTFIIDQKGRVQYIFSSQFDIKKHVEQSLRVLQAKQ